MCRSAGLLAVLLLWLGGFCLPMAHADTFYVALEGKESGDGSSKRPWPSVEYALSKLTGGQTILVKPGIYFGGFMIPPTSNGTPTKPTVIKSQVKWSAKIIGSAELGIYTADHTAWIVIDGFEVVGALSDGVKLSGSHSVVRNCWIHNNSQMGCSSHGQTANTFENNLIEFNGQNIQLHHGIYADGEGLIVRNNIIRHNAAYGLHLYPAVKQGQVYNNLVYGHPYKAGILVQCPAGGGRNQILNNTSVDNAVALDIRNGIGEIVANNVLIVATGDPIALSSNSTGVQIDYNLCKPRSSYGGSHSLSEAPLFVDESHQCYWLRPNSPCRANGNPLHASPTNFWSEVVSRKNPPDIGCFTYAADLSSPAKRAGWYYGFPYRFDPHEGHDMVDFWDRK